MPSLFRARTVALCTALLLVPTLADDAAPPAPAAPADDTRTTPGDPEPPPAPPPSEPQPNGGVDCAWAFLFRGRVDSDEDSMSCNFFPDPCHAESSTSVNVLLVGGNGHALDKTMFRSASTSCSSLADGAIQIWRTDTAACPSQFRATVQVSFQARGAIDPPASAQAGGLMDVHGSHIHAVAAGTVLVTSEGSSPGSKVKVKDVEFTLVSSSARSFEQYFVDQDVATWLATSETVLLSGTSFVSDWANAVLVNGRGEATSAVADPSVKLEIEGKCLAPCTKSITLVLQ